MYNYLYEHLINILFNFCWLSVPFLCFPLFFKGIVIKLALPSTGLSGNKGLL